MRSYWPSLSMFLLVSSSKSTKTNVLSRLGLSPKPNSLSSKPRTTNALRNLWIRRTSQGIWSLRRGPVKLPLKCTRVYLTLTMKSWMRWIERRRNSIGNWILRKLTLPVAKNTQKKCENNSKTKKRSKNVFLTSLRKNKKKNLKRCEKMERLKKSNSNVRNWIQKNCKMRARDSILSI